jgi:hypothetical protein
MVTKITPQPLNTVIAQLQHRYGYKAIHTANEAITPSKTLPTGITLIDDLLKGGLLSGGINAVEGQPTSGATSLVYTLIATAQVTGSTIVYVDVCQLFDTVCAAQLGVQSHQFLLTYVSDLIEALNFIRDLAAFRFHCLVVLDTGNLPLNVALNKLQVSLKHSTMTVVVLSQTPIRDASLRLRLNLQDWLWHRHKIIGYALQVTLAKHPTLSPRHTLINLHTEIVRDA